MSSSLLPKTADFESKKPGIMAVKPTKTSQLRNLLHPYLLPLKALFFFQVGAAACLAAYIPLYLQHLGLNPAENGVIFGILPFLAVLTKPIAGSLSDKFNAPFTIMRIFTVLQLVFMFSIYFVPKMDQTPVPHLEQQKIPCQNELFSTYANSPSAGNLTCISIDLNGNTTVFSYPLGLPMDNENFFNFTCTRSPIAGEIEPATFVRWTMQFWLTGLLLIIGWWGYGSVFTLADAVAFQALESSPVQTTYGSNRVFGSVGYAVFSLMVGMLLDGFSATTAAVDRDFTPAFASFAAVMICSLVTTYFFQPTNVKLIEVKKNQQEDTEEAAGNSTSVKGLMTFEVALFWFGTLALGICTGLIYGYARWHQSDLGATNSLLGLTVFARSCYEAPMMAISGWVIDKLGYHFCMVLALFAFAVRLLAYYAVTEPWMFLAIELTHILCFGLFYPTKASFAFDKAPPGSTGTLLGLLGATFEGFGQGTGGLVAGFLYQKYGGPATWFSFGLFAASVGGIYLIGTACIWAQNRCEKSQYKKAAQFEITPTRESIKRTLI